MANFPIIFPLVFHIINKVIHSKHSKTPCKLVFCKGFFLFCQILSIFAGTPVGLHNDIKFHLCREHAIALIHIVAVDTIAVQIQGMILAQSPAQSQLIIEFCFAEIAGGEGL